MNRVKLSIDGMSCGHCVSTVKKSLDSIQGTTVENVEIGSATASFDPAVTSEEALSAAITNAGFEVTGSQAA